MLIKSYNLRLRAIKSNPPLGNSSSLFERAVKHFTNAIINDDFKLVAEILNRFRNTEEFKHSKYLAIALEKGNYKIAQLLLNNDCDPNTLPEEDITKIFESSNYQAAELLLKHGLDKNYNNGALLAIAAKKGDYRMINLLCSHDADVNINNNQILLDAEHLPHRRSLLSLLYYSNNYISFENKTADELARRVFRVKSQQQKDWEYLEKLPIKDSTYDMEYRTAAAPK